MAELVTLAEAKAHLNIPPSRTADDEEIARFIGALTDPIERHTGIVLPVTVTDRCWGGRRSLLLSRRPVQSITSVTLPGGGTVPGSGYELDGDAGVLHRMAGGYTYRWERGRITIVYTAGLAAVPAHVRQAALIILGHLWETQRGTMGTARATGDDEVWDPRFGHSIPRRALELLGGTPMGLA
ncbi:putative phiE125 gp8 family phage protein [Streptosporangium becharense]|uniref:Putative phiE125 gp8 family phage protein n=1 Tax=Streptosporangium becharense TaxID=1816182 RepID=A0A7W9INV3_9ACTN|nr:hypothetical protein [Streptosporangium becharense]MBB2909321.1 putative phiE125 gp8 family phage protein [Streptosporangium becharense]MBB5823776.1 putative phiE125 gp8 family phage protein [Streptosporangium becharense]